MIEALKVWVYQISTAVFFILAVEMILPKNNIKKYVQFALGLILLISIINPILKFINKEYNFEEYTEKYSDYLESELKSNNIEEAKNKNIEYTTRSFCENLQVECNKYLKQMYPNINFNTKIYAKYNENKNKFEIKQVIVNMGSGKVEKVKRVNISKKENNNYKEKNDYMEENIKKLLNLNFNIPKEYIKVN